MVDGINGPNNQANMHVRTANIAKAAINDGLLGVASGMIGDLLLRKDELMQSDTINVTGLYIEQQSQENYTGDYSVSIPVKNEIYENGIKVADMQSSVNYMSTSEPESYTGDYSGLVPEKNEIYENGIKVADIQSSVNYPNISEPENYSVNYPNISEPENYTGDYSVSVPVKNEIYENGIKVADIQSSVNYPNISEPENYTGDYSREIDGYQRPSD